MIETALRFIPLAFAALFPVVNPIGSALIFLGIAGPVSPATSRRLAAKVALGMVVSVVVIELIGALLLKFFGISLPVLQVAGGLAIAAMGWRMLNAPDAPAPDKAVPLVDADAAMDLAFYPLTFPLTMGPGAIVVVLTLSARAATGDWPKILLSHLAIFIGAALVAVMVYFCYAYAQRLERMVSTQVLHGVLRLISFILLCIGMQIAWGGMHTLLDTVAH